MLVRTLLNLVGLGFWDTVPSPHLVPWVPISVAGTDSAAVWAIALKASVTAFPQVPGSCHFLCVYEFEYSRYLM